MTAGEGARRAVDFGSAHLFVDRMTAGLAEALLQAAVDAGAGRLDTAPLYGHGRSEALVAAVAARSPGVAVTTKVGLDPSPPPPAWRVLAATVKNSIPGARRLRESLRGAGASQASGPSGRFGVEAVRRSVERSLTRLGRIDRLLLHEVHPADITDELLAALLAYQSRGDVSVLGVATGNAVTLDCLRRGQGHFRVAHVSVDPLGPLVDIHGELPDVQVVGHGSLGAGGRTLARVAAAFASDRAMADRWAAAVAGSDFGGAEGLAAALLARAAARHPGEVLVATRRPARVAPTVAAASGARPLPAGAAAVLDEALRRAGA